MALLHYLTGWTGFLAYLGGVRSIFKRIRPEVLCLLIIFLMLLVMQFAGSGPKVFYAARFYWGWICFYFVFLRSPLSSKFLKTVLVILAVYTILEAIAINTVISARSLSNFPDFSSASKHFAAAGNYQRPYSFGGNATVSSSLLLVLLCYVLPGRATYLVTTLAIFLSCSVTGILAYLVSQLLIFKKYLTKIGILRVLLILSAVFLVFCLNRSFFEKVFYKLSGKYLMMVLKIKLSEISSIFTNADLLELFVGRRISGSYGLGGSAVFGFIKYNGILGVLIFSLFSFFHLSGKTLLSTAVLILTSFHYPVIFSIPGQLLFGLLLAEGAQKPVFKLCLSVDPPPLAKKAPL